jgi:hypothetical protein
MATTDKNGREIMPGDTLKVYHFTGARRKKHFMYKFVKSVQPFKGGECFVIDHLNLKEGLYFMPNDGFQHDEIEIVQGYGSDGTPFDQRKRKGGC